jgi:hypothetical protein
MVSMKSVSNITMPAGLWTFTFGLVADIISPGRNSLGATFTILSLDDASGQPTDSSIDRQRESWFRVAGPRTFSGHIQPGP